MSNIINKAQNSLLLKLQKLIQTMKFQQKLKRIHGELGKQGEKKKTDFLAKQHTELKMLIKIKN